MKNIFAIIFAVLGVAFAASFTTAEVSTDAVEIADASLKHYDTNFTGNVEDTEADTALIPVTFSSIWLYNHTVSVTTTDSTDANVIFILEENNERTGGFWYELERDTVNINTAGTSATTRLYGGGGEGIVRGERQRVRVVGYGTQIADYDIESVYKREN